MLAWDFFTHYLFSRRAGSVIRSVAWICVLGVGIGVAALVIVLSVMNGFNGTIRDRLLAIKPHLIAVHTETPHKVIVEILAKVEEPYTMAPFAKQDVIIRTLDGYFSGGVAKGYRPADFNLLLGRMQKKIDPDDMVMPESSLEDVILGPRDIFMGVELAQSMRVCEGDQVLLIPPESLLLPSGEAPPYERVTIKGIVRSELPEVDGKLIFYDFKQGLPRLKKSASLEAGTEFRFENPNNFEHVQRLLAANEVPSKSWQVMDQALFFALKLERIVMSIFLALACLIPSFCIITVIVLLITQKRKDIGLLMAMGLSTEDTKKLFVRLSFMLSAMGMGGGFVVGIVVSLLIDWFPLEILPDIYYDSTIPSKLDPVVLLTVVIGAVIVSWTASVLPAKMSTRWSPSRALR